jgi:hypothetical protein
MIAHEQLGKLTVRIDQPQFLEQPQGGRIGNEKPSRTQKMGK